MAVVVRGTGRTSSLRRVADVGRGAGRGAQQRGHGATSMAVRPLLSLLDVALRAALASRPRRPGDGGRRGAPSPLGGADTVACAGCARRCAARSSTPAAAGPPTSCWSRHSATPTGWPTSTPRPRPARRVARAMRPRVEAARTVDEDGAVRWAPRGDGRDGAVGLWEATGLGRPGAPSPWPAARRGRAPTATSTRRGAVRRRRPLRRPAARGRARGSSSTTSAARTCPATRWPSARAAATTRCALLTVHAGRRAGVGPRGGRRRLRRRVARPAAARVAAGVRAAGRRRDRARPVPAGRRQAARCATTRPGCSTSRSAGPASGCIVTSVGDDDHQPSPFLDLVDPPERRRRLRARRARSTTCDRALTLRAVVAELRRQVVNQRLAPPSPTAAAHGPGPAGRAPACRAPTPREWYGPDRCSDDRPLREAGDR